jgi:hypothetical protein
MYEYKWISGRQETGYFKLPIFVRKRFDVYIIKFPRGSYMDPHKDPAPEGFRHFRFNCVLKQPKYGYGYVEGDGYFSFRLFRPDVKKHWVSPVSGSRYVLSIGWLLKEKNG